MGYCPRGELCPYAHGDEAIVPQMPFGPPGPNGMPMNPLQMMTMMQGGFPMPWMMDASASGAYNPNDARMDMSGGPLSGPSNGRRTSKQYQPTDAVDLSASTSPSLPSLQPTQDSNGYHQASPPPMNSTPPFFPPPNGFVPDAGAYMNGNGAAEASPSYSVRGRGGRGRGGHHGGRSEPGTFPNADQQPNFSGETAPSRPGGGRQDGNRTIVVEKIPQESLSLPAVSEWFSRFGSVTNVAIDAPTAKALVSFSTAVEAKAAWSSQDAVFGNRFVKVFWHRPLAGHGEAGTKKLAASAPLMQNMVGVEKTGAPIVSSAQSTATTVATTSSPTTSNVPATAPLLTPAASIAARKELLEKQIAQQKALFARLDLASTPEEKKDIKAQLRKLGEEMKGSQPASVAVTQRKASTPVGSTSDDKQQLIRAKLDRELDLHAASTSTSDATSGSAATEGESRQSTLLAELTELRKQAAEVGVPTSVITGQPSPVRGRGFVRGRGRGRGRGVHARGGTFVPPPRSLKLDNRPRKLALKGVNLNDEGSMASIEEFYKVQNCYFLQSMVNFKYTDHYILSRALES